MRKPDFLVIGAQKAGTTTVYHHLKEHPQVFMSAVKELRYFSGESSAQNAAAMDGPVFSSFEDYCRSFINARPEQKVGEVSPSYLYYPDTASAIKRFLPSVRLIVVLRNPLDRAISEFWHHWRMGRSLPATPGAFFQQENIRGTPDVSEYDDCLRRGFYARQLKPYLELFDHSQFLFLFFEDLVANPEETMRTVFRFIGVDAHHPVDIEKKKNQGTFPISGVRLQAVNLLCRIVDLSPIAEADRLRLRRKLRNPIKKTDSHAICPELSHWMKSLFFDDINTLRKIVSRDCSHWLDSRLN